MLQDIFRIKKEYEPVMFEDFTPYDDCEPAGVELPETLVDEKKLEELKLSKESTTNEILYELTRKGLRDKGITKK